MSTMTSWMAVTSEALIVAEALTVAEALPVADALLVAVVLPSSGDIFPTSLSIDKDAMHGSPGGGDPLLRWSGGGHEETI